MKALEVHLASGQTFRVDATDVETTRDRATGGLTAVTWTTPAGRKRKLHYIHPEQIVALVVLR